MKIKRFFATNMRQAIRQVRSEQGPDAVILSTRAVDGGIEIISAIDYDQHLVSEMVESVKKSDKQAEKVDVEGDDDKTQSPSAPLESVQTPATPTVDERKSADKPNPQPKCELSASQEPDLTQLRRELNSMKVFLRDQIFRIAQDDFSRHQPVKAEHIKRLTALGLTPKLARQIADEVKELNDPDKSWRQILLCIARKIAVTHDDIVREGGAVALVGPTGVGKTTTLAKLAARFALRYGRQHVVMISTDGYRIGAHKQLQTYGQILNVPVLITAADQLDQTLEGVSDKKLVLIDTTGLSPRDERLNEQVSLLGNLTSVKTHLVLSANIQRSALGEIIRAFSAGNLHGCVLTKLDEAVSLGTILSEIIHNRLPLSYVCNGQRVPEDLHAARVNDVLAHTLTLARRFEKALAEAALPKLQRTTEVNVNAHI